MREAEQHGSRIAIVSGGSRGIGRRVVEELAGEGLDVVILYASNEAGARSVVVAAEAKGVRAMASQADVADEEAVASIFEATQRTFGGVDVVVNAAGVMSLSSLVDFDLSVLDRMLRTNIRGTFVMNQQAARRIRPPRCHSQLLFVGDRASPAELQRLRR